MEDDFVRVLWHTYPLEKVQTTEEKARIHALRLIANELHELNEFLRQVHHEIVESAANTGIINKK